jgi:hypothetical protein
MANRHAFTVDYAQPGSFVEHALHGTAMNPDTGSTAEYNELRHCSDKHLWQDSCLEEMGRIFQGLGTDSKMPKGTDTCFFINVKDIPEDRKATYLRIVVADRPEKDNPRRVRFTVGGDQVDYPFAVSTKSADLTTVKILLNSVLSTPEGEFMTGDLKDFYLGTPLPRFEYLRIPVSIIPQEFFDLYNLAPLVHNGYVYSEIRKGMYGLPQAGRLANERLTAFLEPHGYAPVPLTPGLWRHKTRPIFFTLVVDDFGVQYVNRDDAEHLMATLKQWYQVSEDWAGTRYCGLHLEWDYVNRTCDVSMPGYVERALRRFMHIAEHRPQHAPHRWTEPIYGQRIQYANDDDESPPLDAKSITFVQQVLGTFLYYARAVDNTMLVAINDLGTQQSKGTYNTMRDVTWLLNYASTHPDATVRFTGSDMCLHIESDASYLCAPKARSRAAGFHYLSSKPADPTKPPGPNDPPVPMNGPINVPCILMKEVLASAAEAELGATYYNGKEACPEQVCLEELDWPQPPTPIATDNSTAAGIANDTVKQKRSKAIDMRYYWIRDRVRQGKFHIFWRKGKSNKADYYSKHFPPAHHIEVRPTYLHVKNSRKKNYFEALYDEELAVPSDSPTADPSVLSPTSSHQ